MSQFVGFLSPAEAYTKAEGDARYGTVIYSGTWSGNTPASQGSEATVLTDSAAVPGPGMVLLLFWVSPSSDTKCLGFGRINDIVRSSGGNSTGGGTFNEGGAGATAAGSVSLKVGVLNNTDSTAVACNGRIMAVYYAM